MLNLKKQTVFIVDDEPASLALYTDWCQRLGYAINTFGNPVEFLGFYENSGQHCGPHIVLSDLLMPQMSGLDLFSKIKNFRQEALFIFITGHLEVDVAVDAMKNGAFDYISKSAGFEEFQVRIQKAFGVQKLQDHNRLLVDEASADRKRVGNWGESEGIRKVYALLRKVSGLSSPVLLYGETGTGLDSVAQELHSSGPWRDQVFVSVRGANLTEDGLALAFSNAEKGTLYISEIDGLHISLQEHLAFLISSRPSSCRLVVSSYRDLMELKTVGAFSEKLYYQISVFPIELPPLRERIADIPFLAQNYVTKYASMWSRPGLRFSKNALKVLKNYSWPGNCIELDNTVERAVILSESSEIGEESIQFNVSESQNPFEWLHKVQSLPTLKEFELEFIREALKRSHGRKERAAKILGIGRKTLYRKELELRTRMEGFNESKSK